MTNRTFPSAMQCSDREHRLLFVEARDAAEEALERANAGKIRRVSVENNARDLAMKMDAHLRSINVWTKLNHWMSGQKAADAQLNQLLTNESVREIQQKTDAAVSWLGGFVFREKYRRYVSLQSAVRERMLHELTTYTHRRRASIEQLRFAAGVSARLRGIRTPVRINRNDARLNTALGHVGKVLEKEKTTNAKKQRVVPAEWAEASKDEHLLKQQLLRFQVVSPDQLAWCLARNADGYATLQEMISANAFHDEEEGEPRPSHEEEKKLCLLLAKKLAKRKYRGYQSLQLTKETGNAGSVQDRLHFLREGDPIGKRVSLSLGGKSIEGTVLAADEVYPHVLIVRNGRSSRKLTIDTKLAHAAYEERPGVTRNARLTETTFSISA